MVASHPLLLLPKEQNRLGFYCGGSWITGTGKPIEIRSPYFDQKIGEIRETSPSELEQTCDNAHQAYLGWSKTPIKERSKILFKWRSILLDSIQEIAESIRLENGKTLLEAEAEILKGLEVLEFALSLQNLDAGQRLEVSRGIHCEMRREPLGVVAGITPFNFPIMVPMWMIPIAIALGNSFILKPSEKTPLSTFFLAETFKKAGLPDGVFSIVHGGRNIAMNLLSHPMIRAVGFVGSTPAAKSIYNEASRHNKKVLALGGAKNPVVLMPDADPAVATQGIAASFTGCAGQRCMAASLLIAVGPCDDLIQGILKHAKSITLGQEMGPLINHESRNRIIQSIDRAQNDGASILLDGRSATPPSAYSQGSFLGPTILDHVKPGSEAACDELFGPVLSIIRVESLSQAIEIENRLAYGNAASIFTRDGDTAQRFSEQVQALMVGINIGVPVPREPFSFGGSKDSKFGVGDITGVGSLNLWSNLKKVTTKWQLSLEKSWLN